MADADVVVGALSPRGALDGKLREVYAKVARLAEAAGGRFGVVGGAGSLQVSEGGPTVASGPDFPEAFRSEAAQLAAVLDDLRGATRDSIGSTSLQPEPSARTLPARQPETTGLVGKYF